MDPHNELLRDIQVATASLRPEIPEAWDGFLAMHRGAMSEGEVPVRIKEVVALAISVTSRCEGCIAHHARAAAKAGATPAEVSEILAVALLMGGGTASVYAPLAWEAYQSFRDRLPAGAAP